jgi:hypothetical protein
LKPVTTAVYRDDLSVVEQAVKDGASGGHIAEQFAPFLDGSIGSHHSGAVFVTAHDWITLPNIYAVSADW